MITIHCTGELRDRWPRPLAEQWLHDYPQLFDEDDLRLAHTQPTNHFVEWFLAIHLYHRDGAYSLVEKYLFSNHQRKGSMLAQVLDDRVLLILRELVQAHRVQPPDLLVFQPGERRYWFAEAKGPGDRVSPRQRHSHAAITAALGVPVEVFRLKVAQRQPATR